MIKIYSLLTFCYILSSASNLKAQEKNETIKNTKPYISAMAEGSILGTAFLNINGSSKLSTLRYSAFFHTGAQLHKDFSKRLGLFTGIGIKNIGFIQKENDSTIIRRVYTIGVPFGIKIGQMKKNFIMLGGGIDIPFNYKEKGFVKRGNKDKFNEWFSNRTPAFMPYGFLGARSNKGFQLKLQYYPTNFFNQDYKVENVAIYQNYEAQLFMLTFGADIGGSKKKKKPSLPILSKPSTTQTL